MQIFSILLEGTEFNGKGYFVNFEVMANSESKAREIIFKKAQNMGLINFRIDDIERGGLVTSKKEKIISVSGKSYYSI